MSLDHFMDDFGRDLTRAAHSRRRRRTRMRLALALPAGAALATALALLLPGAGGGGVDAIAAARAALAPSGEIVHMTIQQEPLGSTLQIPPIEQWYAADPERWRTRSILREGDRGNRRSRIRGRLEAAYSNHRMRFYTEDRDVVTIYRNFPRVAPGSPLGLAGGDPTTQLRKLLDEGDIRDDGVVTVDGKQVRRLVRDTDGPGEMTQRFAYYMDPQTFAPVGGQLTFQVKGRSSVRAMAFKVTGYERIPLNAETAKLLKIEKSPNTKFVWMDGKK